VFAGVKRWESNKRTVGEEVKWQEAAIKEIINTQQGGGVCFVKINSNLIKNNMSTTTRRINV
jgi:hypothetical protein